MNKELSVISAYRGIEAYIDNVRSTSDPDYKGLWMKHVMEPSWNQWAAGQFNEQRIRGEMEHPLVDIDVLERCLEMVGHSNIENMIETAYPRLTQLLPSPEPHRAICIHIDNRYDQSTHGVVGTCVGDNILLRINPLVEGWEQYVPWVIAHEYNHCIWGYNYYFIKDNRSQDLLTSIMAEGLADSFGKALCPELSPGWTRALSKEQEALQWQEMKKHLNLADSMDIHRRFFFGDKNAGTPPHTGYTIGFNIVQGYVKNNPGISFFELIDKDAVDILEGSNYDNNS